MKEYDNRETFSKRLKEALNIRNMKPIDLSVKSGVNRSSISQYLSGRCAAKQGNIHAISKALNVSEIWLMGLTDEMERKEIDKKNVPFGINPELESFFMEKLNKNEAITKKLIDLAADLTEEDLQPVFILLQGIRKSKGLI